MEKKTTIHTLTFFQRLLVKTTFHFKVDVARVLCWLANLSHLLRGFCLGPNLAFVSSSLSVRLFISVFSFFLSTSLNFSLQSSSIFSQPFEYKCLSDIHVVRVGSLIIFHLCKLWKAEFSILCDVKFLVRLHRKCEIDQSWQWKPMGNAVESRVAHRNDMAFDYVRWTHTERELELTFRWTLQCSWVQTSGRRAPAGAGAAAWRAHHTARPPRCPRAGWAARASGCSPGSRQSPLSARGSSPPGSFLAGAWTRAPPASTTAGRGALACPHQGPGTRSGQARRRGTGRPGLEQSCPHCPSLRV